MSVCCVCVRRTLHVKMATDIELTAISGDEEELEEGEIDSSGDEEDKKQPEGSDKPPETANKTTEANEQRETRKRELSPPAQNEMSPTRNEKVCCVRVSVAQSIYNMTEHTYAQFS